MTDTPERIWTDDECHFETRNPHRSHAVEYVRADLYEQVKRERDEFRDIAARKSNQVAGLIKTEAAERLAGARVVVKPLEWENNSSNSLWTDELMFGVYYVAYDQGDGWLVERGQFLSEAGLRKIAFGPKVEVLAAAQADYERRILSALAEPAGEAEKDEIPIAADENREVDWVDVTGWGVFKGHAIPVEVARYIATKINLYAEHRTTPPDASAIRGEMEKAERSFETIRIALVSSLSEPGRTAFWEAVDARNALRAALAGAKP